MKAYFSADDLSSLLVGLLIQVSIFTLVYLCVSMFPEELGTLLFYRTQNLSVFKHLAVARKQSQRLDVQWRLIMYFHTWYVLQGISVY